MISWDNSIINLTYPKKKSHPIHTFPDSRAIFFHSCGFYTLHRICFKYISHVADAVLFFHMWFSPTGNAVLPFINTHDHMMSRMFTGIHVVKWTCTCFSNHHILRTWIPARTTKAKWFFHKGKFHCMHVPNKLKLSTFNDFFGGLITSSHCAAVVMD